MAMSAKELATREVKRTNIVRVTWPGEGFVWTLMHPWIGLAIVNAVVLLISFIAYSSQIFIIWPWYGRVLSVELIMLLFPFK